ncbi:MAG: 6-bladed beta-propeller [Rikenellaceae bacterium]
MKKLMMICIIIFIILSAYSCKNERLINEYSIGDITATAKEISWKDLNAEIEHIQFETTEKSLIADIMDLVMTDEYIFVLSSTPKVLQFARDGKFIRQISMQGNGPGEHHKVFSIFINEQSHRLYLAELFGRILEFDFNGVYKGMHKKGDAMSRFIFDTNNNLLESIQVIMGNEQVKLYVMKMDGDTLARFENHVKYEFTRSSVASSYADYKSMFRLGDKIVYHQISTDTVFTYDPRSGKLEPRYCFNNPGGPEADDFTRFMEKMKDLTLLYDIAEDNNFIYATIITPGWKKSLYMIDKKSGKYYLLKLVISDDPEKNFSPKWQHDRQLIDFVNKSDDANPKLVVVKILGDHIKT